MKKLSVKLKIAIAAIGACCSAQAATLTVNNATVPVNPGQYSMISTAIAAASPGDTIIVAGSDIPYDVSLSTIVIDKKVVLVGPGYNPKGANGSVGRILQEVRLNNTASGSTIIGFEFDGVVSTNVAIGSAHKNITFVRNYFNGGVQFANDTCDSIQFINNIIQSEIDFSNGFICFNAGFYNNIFLNHATLNASTSYPSSLLGHGSGALLIYGIPNCVVDHNLFLNGSFSSPLVSGSALVQSGILLNDATITNNIFYNSYPLATYRVGEAILLGGFLIPYLYNNAFHNNITYGGGLIPILIPDFAGGTYTTNVASGNIDNTDPMMNTVFSSSINPYLDFNLDNIGLKPGSPCDSAATDGTNIGPTGGLYPIYKTNPAYLTGEPAVPEVTQLTITGNTTVPVGAPLMIQVKAKKMD